MINKLAHIIYRNTPSIRLRKIYFNIYTYLVKNRRLIASVDGINFDLELGELIDVALYLGKFEPTVVAAIKQFCRPGMIVFDIGANIGAHALRLADIVGDKGHVYAFEPTTIAYTKLENNLALNSRLNVSLFRLALADQAQSMRTISFRSSWRTDGSQKDSTCNVDFVRLDDWAESNHISRVDIIKLDVDGNEFGVLSGGKSLLTRYQPIFIMEMVGPHFADSSRNPFLLLESIGYHFSNIDTGVKYSNVIEMSYLISSDDLGMTTSINILAIAK
jgi:FkbM family methyltransferase